MKTDAANDVKVIQKNGISVRIRPTLKDGTTYFVLDYRAKGKRKLVWRSTMAEARTAANEAIDKITEGQAEVLNLTSNNAHVYLRARDALEGIPKDLDEVAREYAESYLLLRGTGSVLEACRDWARRHAVELPRITVPDAVAEFLKQCKVDGKSTLRLRDHQTILNRFAGAINLEVSAVEPKLLADYLAALPLSERSKANHRADLRFFGRWLALRGYLTKGADWLDGVQQYTRRYLGEITIYSAEEMRRIIAAANDRILPLIVIGGFAGLRHAEIARLDWQDIDLEEGFIEVKAENAKTNTRRIVPLKANLKAFLRPLAKTSGKVITAAKTTNELLRTAQATGDAANGLAPLKWKHNALRHTYISARVAECADVPRVADEAGNSPQIIRSNYLKRMRPVLAAEWFAIQPEPKAGKK